MTVTLALAAAGVEAAPVPCVNVAATFEVIESMTDVGTGYEVLNKLAQGVFPRIACPHLVKPLGLCWSARFQHC